MTLTSVIQRIKEIALAHQQVRSFQFVASMSEFSIDKSQLYPAIILQSSGGTVSLEGSATTLNFRMFLLDRLDHADRNRLDVQSDMIRIAQDILAQMNRGEYSDWRVTRSANMELVVDSTDDYAAGVFIDVNVAIMYKQNVCAVPTDLTSYGSDAEVELVVASGQSFIIRASNTGNRFRITMTEQVDTEEGIFISEKID
jgi:hypothetical protein